MATIRTVRRGSRTYRYLVQSYRWDGGGHKKELYLGTSVPTDLAAYKLQLEQVIWKETWFHSFDRIKAAYEKRMRTLPNSVREKETEEFVQEFTYDTNRIEGSTLSREDTRLLLEHGITPASKSIRDVVETQRHAKLLRRLIQKPEPVDLPHILRWHKELFEETKPDIAGRLRDFEVRIRGSRHVPPPPLEIRPMLIELVRRAARAAPAVHGVQIAADFHFQFENIHPFGDGNGRAGRLAMNDLLALHGFPMLNIRNTRRRGYSRALEESSLLGNARPFLHWFFLKYLREHQFYLRQ